MEIQLANRVIDSLPKSRTLFEHYEDQHAVMLLQQATRKPVSISRLKQSRFGRLLQKPVVKQILAEKGDGILRRDDLAYVHRSEVTNFILTLGLWAQRRNSREWTQTSRPGTNLVLQMNFDREHDHAYEQLLKPIVESPFMEWQHPICKKGRTTMAWVRLDLDLQSGEALIEEVQNDWVRRAMSNCAHGKALQKRLGITKANRLYLYRNDNLVGSLPKVIEYVENYLVQRSRFWAQAVLSAAIWFLAEELNINSIWYHDYETGNRLKKIRYNQPPRSIYKQLPKKFCFELTDKAPMFIVETAQKGMKQRLKTGKERFWHLSL